MLNLLIDLTNGNYWLAALFQFLFSAATGLILFIILGFVFKRIDLNGPAKEGGIIYPVIKKPMIWLLSVSVLMFSISGLQNDYPVFAKVNHVLLIAFIFSIAYALVRIAELAKIFIMRNYDLSSADNLKARKVLTQFDILKRIINLLIIFIAFSVALLTFDKIREIGYSLLASAGIFGIIVGLAAQKYISTLIAGIQLAITQPIRLEDAVFVENEWGWIEEINLTYVVVRIWDKRRLVLPSTYFIEKPFQNWTKTSADLLGPIFIYTDYNVDLDAIRREMTRLLENNGLWDGKANVLQVTNATESTVECRLLVSAKNASDAWELRVFVREKILQFLKDNYPESLPRTRVLIHDPEKNNN